MSSFFGNISKLTLSRGMSVGLGLLTTPIVARLYLPEHFGIYGVVTAAATWLSAFATLGYYLGIPMASTRREARTLVRLCVWITLALTVLAIGIFGLGGPLVADLLNEPGVATLLWFVPVLFFIDSIGSISDSTLSREGRFGTMAAAGFLSGNLPRLITIAWALALGAGVMGLFAGYVLGAGIAVFILAVVAYKVLWNRKGEEDAPAVSYRQAIMNHIQFPKINMWNNLLRVSTSRLPVFVLAIYFDPATVGFFTFASTIVSMPLRVLGSSLSQVFYPEAAREYEESGAVKRALHFSLKFQSTVGVLPLVALGLMAPLFFEVVFGFRWQEAGVLCQMLSFMMLMNLLTAPVLPLFLIRKEAGTLFIFSLAQLAVTAAALLVGGYLGSARLAMALYSAAAGLIYLYMLIKILRAGKADVISNLGSVLKEVVLSVLTLGPAALTYYLFGWRWYAIGLCAVGSLVYVLLLIWRDKEIYERIRRIKQRLTHTQPPPEEAKGE